jgi:hypothetical protein
MYRHSGLALAAALAATGSAAADLIAPSSSVINVLPGASTSIAWSISSLSQSIVGYTMWFEAAAPGAGATGQIGYDVAGTTFGGSQNVFIGAGIALDPLFSQITATAGGGLAATALSSGLTPVLPQAGVNDVLVDLMLTISPDALGEFTITLGPGSALSDPAGFAVPFTTQSLTVNVIPAPGAAVLAVGLLPLVWRRRGGDSRLKGIR